MGAIPQNYYSTSASSWTYTNVPYTWSVEYGNSVREPPARRKTNREWLAEEVDRVCALARK